MIIKITIPHKGLLPSTSPVPPPQYHLLTWSGWTLISWTPPPPMSTHARSLWRASKGFPLDITLLVVFSLDLRDCYNERRTTCQKPMRQKKKKTFFVHLHGSALTEVLPYAGACLWSRSHLCRCGQPDSTSCEGVASCKEHTFSALIGINHAPKHPSPIQLPCISTTSPLTPKRST